jgi:hypothetical protein
MSIKTNWLSPPRSIKGQDQLGSQAPCEMTYSQLLPGITNVTDRARYFSFYSWVAWSFDHRLKTLEAQEYVEYYRRADCLYTLIAAFDARENGIERQAEAMIGRLKLVPALDRLTSEGSLRLSEYATQEDKGHRYFKNPMGGLGQYYAGPLMELGLCKRGSSGPWMLYSNLSGVRMGKAVETALPADTFWNAVAQDTITLDTLASLESFAPRHLSIDSSEHQQLVDIFLSRESGSLASKEESGAQRRRTLGLVLHLAREIAGETDASIHEWTFRPSVYARALPSGGPWFVPANLAETQILWSIYERNDLFATACQTIFAASLRAIEAEAIAGRYYDSVENFAVHCAGTTLIESELAAFGANTFEDLVREVRQCGPSITAVDDLRHEFKLEQKLMEDWRAGRGTSETFIARALHLLATLAARNDAFPSGYGNLVIQASDLWAYPINLASFETRTAQWGSMRLAAVAREWIVWTLNTHLSVALRKLAQTRTSSFHLQPTEHGLRVTGEIPDPTRTLPRIRQAVRILEDLGALEETDAGEGELKISWLGETLLKEILA